MAPSKRRGTTPVHTTAATPAATPSSAQAGHPVLCLQHLQEKFGIDKLEPSQCQAFLLKWHKRAKLTWTELVQHDRHGLGSEFLPKSKFKTAIPEHLERDKYLVFRHEGNHAFAGFRTGDVFHVLWIEAKYNDLYNHGS